MNVALVGLGRFSYFVNLLGCSLIFISTEPSTAILELRVQVWGYISRLGRFLHDDVGYGLSFEAPSKGLCGGLLAV